MIIIENKTVDFYVLVRNLQCANVMQFLFCCHEFFVIFEYLDEENNSTRSSFNF